MSNNEVQRYSMVHEEFSSYKDKDGDWVKFEDIKDRVGVWGEERILALKNTLMLVEATELLQLMVPVLRGHMAGEDSDMLRRVQHVLDQRLSDIVVVAEVIATGGPHDAEDRVLCQLVADLPPIGTKVVALSAPAYELDDGPLTDVQIKAIRSASPATDIPREAFNRRLFAEADLSLIPCAHEFAGRPAPTREELDRLDTALVRIFGTHHPGAVL